ncbi:MAG: alpha/beta fold hydrolase [Gemmatimonadaceae bacterium]|nr:alpha/beta fold hydrolase [Gloeobacterales cyanobacterium ES-bin-141]
MLYGTVEQSWDWHGTNVYTNTCGNGLPVVMLHSLGGLSNHWQFVLPALARAGYQATTIDLPGHGDSGLPKTELTPHWMGEALARSLARPSVLVGSSLGGWVALQAYLARPNQVRGICLIASSGLEGMPLRPARLSLRPGKSDLETMLLEAVFYNPRALTPSVRRDFWRGAFAPALLRLIPQGILSAAQLEQVRCPVLIVWGAEDKILPLEWAATFANHLPQAKTVVIERCGHLPQLECPDALIQELLAFVGIFR